MKDILTGSCLKCVKYGGLGLVWWFLSKPVCCKSVFL